MNERIEQLAEQANVIANTAFIPDSNWDTYRDLKFAELIVQECVQAVQNRGGMCGALASNWIKEHFGIDQ